MNLPFHLLREIGDSFTQKEFHCKPEQSQVKVYSKRKWELFSSQNGFAEERRGIYIPETKTAYINEESPYSIAIYFHEYFGHGLLCEHSVLGKELEAAQKPREYLDAMRERDTLGLRLTNRENHEGFALWLQAQLCQEGGYAKLWDRVKKGMSIEDKGLLARFEDAEKRLTRFGFAAQMGFPKEYTIDTLDALLTSYYPEGEIDLAIVYGSQKPLSDIDLLVVSSRPSQNFFNGWLDIYQIERQEFFYLLERFDISITEALTTGSCIRGQDMYTRAKKQLETQKITKRAIRHNRRRAEEIKVYINATQTEREQKKNLSYEGTYQKTAELLAQGKRVLGKKNCH